MTEQALVLSTSHVPREAWLVEELGFGSHMPRANSHDYGWVVFLAKDEKRPVPEWFGPILKKAQQVKATFVIFDKAGDVLDDLAICEW